MRYLHAAPVCNDYHTLDTQNSRPVELPWNDHPVSAMKYIFVKRGFYHSEAAYLEELEYRGAQGSCPEAFRIQRLIDKNRCPTL